MKALKEAAAAADKVSDSASKKVNSVTGDEASVQVSLCSLHLICLNLSWADPFFTFTTLDNNIKTKINKKLSEIERAQKRLRQMKQLRYKLTQEICRDYAPFSDLLTKTNWMTSKPI